MKPVGIIGTGGYLPEQVRTNEWFDQFEMVSSIDVFNNSGVKERRIAAKGQLSSDMEAKALIAAVKNAGISIEDIDLILDGPNVNDQISPQNAAALQYKSGAKNAVAMNVDMACASLIPQIEVAWAMIAMGRYNTVACVVATNQSISCDYTEKACMILGDGAAAFILQAVSEGKGILSVHMETEGRFHNTVGISLRLPHALISEHKSLGHTAGLNEGIYFYVNRAEKEGVEGIRQSGIKTSRAAEKALAKAGYSKEDIDFLILHNPSIVLVEEWRKALAVPKEKTYVTIEKYGNMGPATMGINLHEAAVAGKIKDGDLVVLCAPGAGFHFNAAVLRWGR